MDREYVYWLTQEIDRLQRNLESLQGEVADVIASPARGTPLLRSVHGRIDGTAAQLRGLHTALLELHATLPPSPPRPAPRPGRRHG
jgi:hypothetical protein